MGGQVDRAVRRGLHPAEAGLQPRAHHHPQVAAARRARPARLAARHRTAAPAQPAAQQQVSLQPVNLPTCPGTAAGAGHMTAIDDVHWTNIASDSLVTCYSITTRVHSTG